MSLPVVQKVRLMVLATVVLLFIPQLVPAGDARPRRSPPRAVEGRLDLTRWDFEADGPVDLSGTYEFYWQQLLTPSAFHRSPPPQLTGFMEVPALWNRFVVAGKRLSGSGYATYRLKIELGPSPPPLALKLLDMATAYKLFVNGRAIITVGRPGPTVASTQPGYQPRVISIPQDASTLDILFQVANFHHMKGGPWEIIKLGSVEQLNRLRQTRINLDLMMVGCILIMGFYNIGIFFIRRQDPSPLYFALFCLLISIRTLTSIERYLLNLLPGLNWEFFVKIEYLSAYLALPMFMMLINTLFREDFHRIVLRVILGLGVLFAVVVVATPVRIFSYTVQTYQGIIVLGACYGFFVISKSIVNHREGARVIFGGSILLFVTTVNDILDANGIIHTGQFVQLGLVAFIFSNAILLYLRFSTAFETIETQRQRLQEINRAYLREIDERRKAEAALLESHNLLETRVQERTHELSDTNRRLREEVDERQRAETSLKQAYEALKRTQAQLIQSGKLASIGELASGVAHELNQPLTVIRSTAQLVQHKFRHAAAVSADQMHKYLQMIEKNTTRMVKIIGHLRTFSRQSRDEFSPVDVNHVVKESFLMLNEQLHLHRIEVERDLQPELPIIAGDANKLEQVLINLVTNARDAILGRGVAEDRNTAIDRAKPVEGQVPGDHYRGKIRISTRRIRTGDEAARNHPGGGVPANPGGGRQPDQIEIQVSDNGGGIPEDGLERIFDPFFTTKAVGKGTGLGLSISYGIIKDHHGRIEVIETGPEGTTIAVRIPVADRSTAPKA